ncbi:MAG: nucleotidyltransferase domain-containing protein [Candidatus Binatia bacterium]
MKKNRVAQNVLDEIIRRVVKVVRPERIILFGSAARGEIGPNSDVDLLVVKKGRFDRSRLVGDIYRNLHGVGQAVDVVVVTPEEVERYRHTHCLVVKPALREGREVYHA